MNLNENQCRQIEKLLPIQRGNVKIDNRRRLAALIYRLENGCSWRALPQPFGPWHVIYVRLNRWAKTGGLSATKVCALDSTAAKLHPDAHGARKKR